MRDVYSAGRAVERGAWGTPDGIDADQHPAGGPWPDARHADPPGSGAAVDAEPLAAHRPPDPHDGYSSGAALDAPPDDLDAAEDRPDAAAGPVTRRAALKVLGVFPAVAGALGAQPPTAGAPQHPRQPHTTPNQPTSGAPQPPAGKGLAKFFTPREARTAGVLADDIIPRDERSGSATEAGVIPFIDYHMSVPETTAETRTAMRGGLRWLDVESRRRFGVPYDKAAEAQRHQILDAIAVGPAKAAPGMRAGAAFFAQFRNLVGAGFFSSAVGHRDLRYQGNVFNPNWNGCPQPALDKLGVSYAVMDTRVAPK
jgi:hypothetical protein